MGPTNVAMPAQVLPLPSQGVGTGLALRCSAHPLHRPGPYLRRALGCSEVVSRGTRSVAAPRGSNPRSRVNPQGATRSRRQHRGSSPSCAQPRRNSTSIQPQSCAGHGRRVPRHGGAGKKRVERNETNRMAALPRCGCRACPGEGRGLALPCPTRSGRGLARSPATATPGWTAPGSSCPPTGS